MLQSMEPQRGRKVARILYASRHKTPVPVNALGRSLIRRAVAWCFPTAYQHGGLYAFLTVLLSCSVGSLRHWLHGRREMPDRVRLILISTIRNRLESGAAILVELEAVQPKAPKPPGFHGSRARQAKEQDDAAKAQEP